MRAVTAAVLAVCGSGLVLACKEGTGPSRSDLVGTWQLVKCEFVSTQGLGTVELIAGGGSGTMTLTATDTIRVSVTPASGSPLTFTGTYQVNGIDLLQVTPAGVSWYYAFDMSLSGGTLTLSNGSGEWDFNHDTQPEPAKWNLTGAK